jgi:hypothetical protein
VKIYVAAVGEALRSKERGGQNRMKLTSPPPKTKKNGAFLSFTPIEGYYCTFLQVFSFWNLTQEVWTKLRVLVLCFPDFTEHSIIRPFFLGIDINR